MGFHAPKGRMVFAPGLEGGVGHDSGSRYGEAAFLYMTHSTVVINRESARPCRTKRKRRGRERPPPPPPKKWGAMRTRIAGIWGMPLSGPMGVALVLIYPCGKAQKQPRRSGAESTETDL